MRFKKGDIVTWLRYDGIGPAPLYYISEISAVGNVRIVPMNNFGWVWADVDCIRSPTFEELAILTPEQRAKHITKRMTG